MDNISNGIVNKKQYNLNGIILKDVEPETHIFKIVNGNKSIMEFKTNGDIFIKGRLIENDKEVVDRIREFLKMQGFIS